MKTPEPHIDDILRVFFDRQHSRPIELLLRECLESEGERLLLPRDRVVLAAEREFSPEGAVARTMYAEDLLVLLSVFVREPWLHGDPATQREQLAITSALTAHVVRSGLVEYDGIGCLLLDIRSGLTHARRELNRRHPLRANG